MPYSKKEITWCVLNILRRYTDKQHCLTQDEIVNYVLNDYNLECDRKTIGEAYKTLTHFGFVIETVNRKGAYLKNRHFNPAEIRYLIDAIYSSKSISTKDANNLIDKVISDLSDNQKNLYPKLIKTTSTSNNSVTNNFFKQIDIITKAINEGLKIKFNYTTYSSDGKEKLKFNGKFYTVSPYYLINNFGKYYLYCLNEDYKEITNYKIDKIRNIKILDEKQTPLPKSNNGKIFKINEYLEEHIYLFTNKVIDAKILLEHPEQSIGDVIEWFPKAIFSIENNMTFAKIRCDEDALYYWALQYINSIKIISPIDLRNRIMLTLRNSLNTYSMLPKEQGDIEHFNIKKLIVDWTHTDMHSLDFINNHNKEFIINSLSNYLEKNILEIEINNNTVDNINNIILKHYSRSYAINIHYFENEYNIEDINKISNDTLNEFHKNNYLESYLLIVFRNIINGESVGNICNKKAEWKYSYKDKEDKWISYGLICLENYY